MQNEDIVEVKRMVPGRGFEPRRGCPRQPLKLVRLPIPPPRHKEVNNPLGRAENHTPAKWVYLASHPKQPKDNAKAAKASRLLFALKFQPLPKPNYYQSKGAYL